MSKLKILQADQSYTFRSYFEMTFEVDQILAELGYRFVSDLFILPKPAVPSVRLPLSKKRSKPPSN